MLYEVITITHDFYNDTLADHFILFTDISRDFDIVQRLLIEIDNSAASGTVQMMVAAGIRVKPPLTAEPLDVVDNPDLDKCRQCPVDCIKRNTGVFPPDNLVERIDCRMVF